MEVAMMGEKAGAQGRLFYQFDLDEVVPADHLLRKIHAVLDLSDLRAQLAPYYSHTGRPSIDPELMIRMLVIGYCYGIRSERRLCEEVRLNLAYRWFCRLGLEEAIPDHSAFSRARHGRFRDADILRKVFENTVKTCMDKGLVGGEGFATDASIIRADANRQNHIDGGDDHDWTGGAGSGGSGPSRAVSEYLKGLDREAAPPKEISLSDPASRLTAAVGRPAFFGWCTNYLIDVKHAVIMDVVATPALRTAEVNATKVMIDRVEQRFGVKPKRLIGDTAYGRRKCWVGWSKKRTSSRTYLYGTKAIAKTEPLADLILLTTQHPTALPVQTENDCCNFIAPTSASAAASPKPTCGSTAPANTIATLAR
jgi:transposase